MKSNFSLLVLTRNEERHVKENILKIKNYLENLEILENYEIIVSDYSEDSTFDILETLANNDKKIKPVRAPRKGIGCGLVTAVLNSSYDYVMFYPIDMSWKINVIHDSINQLQKGVDVVIGSRGIKNSMVKRPLKRRIFSKGYNILVNCLFDLGIQDTQGTLAFKKSDFLKYNNKLIDDGPFLQTEILIHSKKLDLKLIEIPSIVSDNRKDSSVNVFSFAIDMTKKAIKKKFATN